MSTIDAPDSRVVVLQGARQVGKGTLAWTIADALGMARTTLDDQVALRAAV